MKSKSSEGKGIKDFSGHNYYENDYDKKKELSNCCNAGVHVHSEEEGTNYYVCDECSKPCDLKSWKTKPVEDKLKEKHSTGKTKELDWHIKWDYLLNKKKWKNPDEVNKVLTKFVEDLLIQQRSELLEEILNLECLKEEKDEDLPLSMVISLYRNQLRKEIIEEINKL